MKDLPENITGFVTGTWYKKSRTKKGGICMEARAWGNEYRTTTVCVDSYEDGILSGRFYNPYLDTGQSFESLTQFLLKMEQALDAMKFPQPYTATRTFTENPGRNTGPPGKAFRHGRLATFAIRVIFRQNASWQGSVRWLDTGQEQSFRSVLELIFLMDSALTEAEEQVS